jgi:hypothetical protein
MSIIRDDDNPLFVIGFVVSFLVGAGAYLWLTSLR